MYDVKFLADHEKEISKGIITDECVNDILELYVLDDIPEYRELSSFDFDLFNVVNSSYFDYLDDKFIDYKKFKQRIKDRDISIYKKTINIQRDHYKYNLIQIENAIYNAFLDLYYDADSKIHAHAYYKGCVFVNIRGAIKYYIEDMKQDDLDKAFYNALKHTELEFDKETIETMYKFIFK